MEQLLSGLSAFRYKNIGGTEGGRSSITVTRENPASTCTSCFSGCWRNFSGCIRNVRNCPSPVNCCRSGDINGAVSGSQQHKHVSESLLESNDSDVRIMSGGRRYTEEVTESIDSSIKEQSNRTYGQYQFELISKFCLLFSEEDQNRTKAPNDDVFSAEVNSLKECNTSITGVANSQVPDFSSEVKNLQKKLENYLVRISMVESTVGSAENYSSVTIKELSSCLDSFSLNELVELCEMVNVPDNLIKLFNSKLLKAQLLVYITQKKSGLFRERAGAADFKTFNSSFESELLTKVNDGNGLPILNKHNVLACYVKQQLRDEYKLTGIEKETLENKLASLKKPVDQVLYGDILDTVHCQCEVAKEVTEEQANKDKVLTLTSFAVAIFPSLYGGLEIQILLQLTSSIKGSRENPLETFIQAWPEVKQNRTKATLAALEEMS